MSCYHNRVKAVLGQRFVNCQLDCEAANTLSPLSPYIGAMPGTLGGNLGTGVVFSNIKKLLIFPMLVQCWFTVYDAGPASNQQWDNISWLLGLMSLPRLFVSHMREVNVLRV